MAGGTKVLIELPIISTAENWNIEAHAQDRVVGRLDDRRELGTAGVRGSSLGHVSKERKMQPGHDVRPCGELDVPEVSVGPADRHLVADPTLREHPLSLGRDIEVHEVVGPHVTDELLPRPSKQLTSSRVDIDIDPGVREHHQGVRNAVENGPEHLRARAQGLFGDLPFRDVPADSDEPGDPSRGIAQGELGGQVPKGLPLAIDAALFSIDHALACHDLQVVGVIRPGDLGREEIEHGLAGDILLAMLP